MTDAEMNELIETTMATQYEADTYSADEPTHAHRHPPATEAEIARLEVWLRSRGLSLPPSFAQFLRLNDGIDDYIPSMGLALRSIAGIEAAAGSDENLAKMTAAYSFVFASGEDSSAVVGFVAGSEDATGEMPVEMLTESDDINRYGSFEKFLRDILKFYRDVVQGERADRAALKDD